MSHTKMSPMKLSSINNFIYIALAISLVQIGKMEQDWRPKNAVSYSKDLFIDYHN